MAGSAGMSAGICLYRSEIDKGQIRLNELDVFRRSLHYSLLQLPHEFERSRPQDMDRFVIHQQIKIVVKFENLIFNKLKSIGDYPYQTVLEYAFELACPSDAREVLSL